MDEAMNPDFMEYQMDIDDPTITSPQAMSQPTCPYRPLADAPNGSTPFQSSWSHNPHLELPIPPFNPVSNPTRMYWGGISPQNSQQLDSLANGHNHLLAHPGRPGTGSATRYDHTPFNQTSDFVNPQRFHQPDQSRHPMPRMPDMDQFHNSNEGRQGESHTPGTMPSLNPVMPSYTSTEESMQRRNEFLQAQMARSQQETQPNRNPHPPPTLTVQSTFFPTHLPQPNFTSNRNLPFLLQGSPGSPFQYTRNIPIPLPSEPSRQDRQFNQTQRRAWARESNISPDYTEDSDEDSVDSLNARPDHRDVGSQSHHLRHATANGHGQRRPVMSSLENEERELAMERSRAARRAAIAAAKLVASPAALASLEQVDLSSLTGDDRNCIICYNEFGIMNPDGNIECAVRLPKCKHIFGDHCLKHWLKDSDSCPYCRDKLPSEPKRSQADEMRRLFVLSRPVATGSQPHGTMSNDERATLLATENRHYGQPFLNRAQMQTQLHALYALEAQNRSRIENAALEQSELAARYNNMQRQEEWIAMHSHGSSHAPRSIPDHDSRRRNRQRANSIRSSTANNQARFSNPALRANTRDSVLQNPNSRTPNHSNRQSFDVSSATSPRSVTPHPGVLGAVPTPSFPSMGARRSSLPSESSPLREATLAEAQQQQPPHGNEVNATDSMFSPSTAGYETGFAAARGSHEASAGGVAGARMQGLSAWSGRPMSESFVGNVPSLVAGGEGERVPMPTRHLYGMRH